jgi:tRNA(adenine34) deaminase
MPTPDELMEFAIAEARLAEAEDEVPIGCVIWHEPTQRIIGRGHNTRERDRDPTAHAEIVALQQAARELGHWRVTDSTLIVTLEPCPMCAGAIVNARVPRLIYGCDDPKAGAVRTLFTLCEDARLNHRVEVIANVQSEACAALLRDFFQKQRAAGKRGQPWRGPAA